MHKFFRLFITLSILILIAFIVALFAQFTIDLGKNISSTPPTEQAIHRKFAKEHAGFKNLHFDLVDPELAPPEIKSFVLEGYQIMLHTHQELPHYANDLLSCTNCHFAGGITTGGSGGGISLAGVAAKYPAFNSATGKVEDLAERINNCFAKSMNGKPLPLDSKEMLALVTYMHWISYEYPTLASSPWLGLRPLKTKHVPDPARGREVYAVHCATCHGSHGEGANLANNHPGSSFPPVWGSKSFNSKAGMNNLETLSSFVYFNMPFEEPHLSVEDAMDVSAFIIQQPRP